MLFEQDITITTVHTSAVPLVYPLKVARGVIHQLDVYFPPGCGHHVRVVIKRGVHQVYPTNSNGYMKGDGVMITGPEFKGIFKSPYVVDLVGWQEGASYDHIVTVRLWMLEPWQLVPFSDEMMRLAIEESGG